MHLNLIVVCDGKYVEKNQNISVNVGISLNFSIENV